MKIHGLWYQLLPHPHYSPVLVPSDYLLFLNIKNGLYDGIIAYFKGLRQSDTRDGKLCTYCIELIGDHVER